MGRFLRRKQVAGPPPDDGFWQVPARFNFARDVVEAFAADPLRPALTYVDRDGVIDRRTFADVATDANRWSGLLRGRGLVPGDRLLVVVGKTPAWHAILLGAMKAGLVTVPCSEMLRAADLTFRAEHSGARLVVADLARAPELARIDLPLDVVLVEEADAELRRFSSVESTHDTGAGDVAFILYTSGTTKDPKGATHTHAYTWAARRQAEYWLDARPGDLVWCTAGTGWAKSIWNVLLGPWSCGAETVIHDGAFDAEQRFELLQRLGVTVLCQAPTEYRLMAKHPSIARHDLGRLRHAVSAGEPLNPEVIAAFRDALGVTVYDGYGQTENTLLVANVRSAAVKPGSMGLPTPGHEVAVIDDAGNEQPDGVEGDIAVRGRPPSLFIGYWNAPDETRAVFRDEWYVTGDRATRDADGYLWFTGRADDVIISAAYRIGPFEVESALLEHPAVAESAAVGKPDPDRGEIVKAFVVVRAGFEPSSALAAELQDHVKAVTAPYKYPREIEFVTELPKTASGKIRRVELRERARGEPPGAGTGAAVAAAPSPTVAPDVHQEARERERADLDEARRRKSERAAAALELATGEAAARAERRADLERRTAEALAADRARAEQEQREAAEAQRAEDEARRAAEQARREQEQRDAAAAAEALLAAEQARIADELSRRSQEAAAREEATAAAQAEPTGRTTSEPTSAPSERASRREEERRRRDEEKRRKEEEKAAAEQRKREEAEERRAAAERGREAERRRKEDEKRRRDEQRAAAERDRLEAEARQRAAQVAAAERRQEAERQRAIAEEQRKEDERRRKEDEKRRKEEDRKRPQRPPGSTVPDPGDEHLDERPNAELIERLRAYGRREPDVDPPE